MIINQEVMQKRNIDVFKYFFVITFLLFIELLFFREVIFNSNKLFGDSGDGRFTNLIVEHWFDVFSGKQAIRDLPIFYPVEKTLGYSDALFGYALPYSIFRFFGIDMFSSYKFTLILLHILGSLCLFYLLKQKFRFGFAVSAIATIICAYANSYSIKSIHTQLFFFSAVPCLVICIMTFFDKYPLGNKRIIYGILSLFWVCLILMSSYYVGFFILFFIIIMLIVYIIIHYKHKDNLIYQIIRFIRENPKEFILYFLVGLVFIAPFFWIYFPVLLIYTEGFNWEAVSPMLPQWFDFINTSTLNVLWGGMLQAIIPDLSVRPYAWELSSGFPIITFTLLILSIVFIVFRHRVKPELNCIVNKSDHQINNDYTLIYVLAISILIVFFLLLKVDGFSLWWVINKFVPGAKSIRAVSRFLLFLSLPASIVIGFYLKTKLSRINSGPLKAIVISIILVVLILDNTIKNGWMSFWNKTEMNEILNEVPCPPRGCKVMFLIGNDSTRADYNYQLDSWMIAEKYGLKTINGYSGLVPKGWEGVQKIKSLDYLDFVNAWIEKYELDSTYAFDMGINKWILVKKNHTEQKLKSYRLGERIFFSKINNSEQLAYLGRGWSNAEEWGIWTDGNQALLTLPIDSLNCDLTMVFDATAYCDDKGLRVMLMVNGVKIADTKLYKDEKEYSFSIPNEILREKELLNIEFNIINPNSPKNLGQSGDDRMLGIGMRWIEIRR